MNSPKHPISSEVFIFFWTGELAPPQTPRPVDSTLAPNQTFWIRLRVPQNLSQIYVTETEAQVPGTSAGRARVTRRYSTHLADVVLLWVTCRQ